jgi:hypothetical protein
LEGLKFGFEIGVLGIKEGVMGLWEKPKEGLQMSERELIKGIVQGLTGKVV